MKRAIILILLLLSLLLTGCGKKTDDVGKAQDYLISQAYNITSNSGEILRYTLEKDMLAGGMASVPWAMQKEEPDKYIGKEIIIYAFKTDSHPLMDIYDNLDSVNLYVMMSNGKIIGGYSYPDAAVYGAYSLLDGKSIEEVTGLSFKQWIEDWSQKYGE